MKFQLMIRSRPDETIARRHARLKKVLESWKGEWALRSPVPPLPEAKDCSVSLRKCLPKGVGGRVWYGIREFHLDDHRIYDDGMFDDWFTLEFDPERFDYRQLVLSLFGKLIAAFGAYKGKIENDAILTKDFPKSAKAERNRSGVFRLNPVCFFDAELTSRSFGMSPQQVAKKLHGSVHSAKVVSGGVLIVASTEILPQKEADSLGKSLRKLLG